MMEVFLSWSGERSHGVARAFYGWLPHVIQDIHPFISSDSVSKGETWLTKVREALEASNGVGLFFLTPDALTSGWLLFEAGGIAALGKQRVCTVCIDILPHDLKPPLSFFQATQLVRDDVFKLISDLNVSLSRPLAPQVLAKSFERSWPDFEVELDALAAEKPKQTLVKPSAESKSSAQDLAPVMDTLRRIEARLGSLEQQERAIFYSPSDPVVARAYERHFASPNANALANIAASQPNITTITPAQNALMGRGLTAGSSSASAIAGDNALARALGKRDSST